MAFLDDLLAKFGAMSDRAHVFSFTKASAPGVMPRFTRDLLAIPDAGRTGGQLVELYTVLDERHDLTAASHLRLDLLEEDWLFSGGLDDRIMSLLGTGAAAPEAGAPARQLTTVFRELDPSKDFAAAVEQFKRSAAPADFGDSLLVLKESPDAAAELHGTKRTHVIAWHRLEHDDIGAHSELYFVLDVEGGPRAASPVLEITAAPPGVALRLRGVVTDAAPLAGAEPLAEIPVALEGRTAVSGDDGVFVLDARLAAGDHPLRFARPGIDARELTVRVTAAANDAMSVAILDGANQLVAGVTPQAATEASVVTLALAQPVALRVHKLRGTVHWPDSRFAHFEPDYKGTPLAERRVCVLPLPADADLTPARPRTSREWEALKARPELRRSTRPGRPAARERTDVDGRFEVKYVDFTAGNRFLLWVERFAPRAAGDVTSEAPDHLVRTLRRELISITGATLVETARMSNLDRQWHSMVDHEFNLTRDVVPWGVDTLRVADVAGVRTLARPNRENREAFDTAAALAAGTGEGHAVPANRIVDGLELQALPLVPLFERSDEQGRAVAVAREALAASAAVAFPGGADVSGIRIALDVSRLENAVDWDATHDVMGAPVGWDDATTTDARKVELLERTLVVRPQLGRGLTLRVGDAHWHSDAVSLADTAFVTVPRAPGPLARDRRLDAAFAGAREEPTHLPVLQAVAPVLPGIAPSRVYLAPGHGLYVLDAAGNHGDLDNWGSNRGGYLGGAGEDETDAWLARDVRRIVLRNRGTVHAPRELDDLTAPGVFPPGAAVTADFPRRWQQNPLYFLGPGNWGPGNKNNAGITARVNHIRGLAAAPARIDLVLAIHTNAGGGRGTVAEYLNVDDGGAEGNPLGLAFSGRVRTRTLERTHLDQYGGGVRTMDRLNPEAVGDLTDTFDHWVLEDAGINSVCRYRVLNQPAAIPPAHPAMTVACWTLTHPDPPGPAPAPPIPAGHAANTAWDHNRFPAAGPPLRIPVTLAELGFHDSPADAALLSRAWLRRLAAEGMAIAVDEQLRADPAGIGGDDVRAVLRLLFGDTAAMRALQVQAPVTAASIQAALQDVADPTAPAAAGRDLGALCEAALAASRALTRRGLVDLLRDRLREIAGWQPTDAAAIVEEWVAGPITGATLERPAAVPTRAEAAVLACAAIGLPGGGLAAAETVGVGEPASPLLVAAPDSAAAYFSAVEAAALVTRIATLRPRDVHRVRHVWLGDARWRSLDAPRGSGSYELDPGTPVVVVVETAGAAWKTVNQAAANRLDDLEIVVDAPGGKRRLRCAWRDPRRVASATWLLDLPPTRAAVDVKVELWARHRAKGSLLVGLRTLKLKVRSS